MALEAIKTSIQERVEDLKASPEKGAKGVIGGIIDATVMNVARTLGDVVMKVVPEATQGLIQAGARPALAAKELLTLHPGKAVAQLAIGAERGAEHAINIAKTGAETVANTINRITRGIARAVAGLVGEDIFGPRYGELMKEIPIKLGIEKMPSEEKPMFG